MAEQFKEQGGAATMDPGAALRWATSRLMTQLCKPGRLEKKRTESEKQRTRAGKPHTVEYFHQLEDGYSHLAVQLLPAIGERYDIELVCHLVAGPQGKNSAEPDLLLKLSRHDSFNIAGGYGLHFPRHDAELEPGLVQLAAGILARQAAADFPQRAPVVNEALWAGNKKKLQQLANQWGCANDAVTRETIAVGTARRHALKHYSGAMFYYAGEWYWGVDRLYHLEQRLGELGADRNPGTPLLAHRPRIDAGPLRDSGSLTLEFYASLRSPYTAISFDRVVHLARDTGVKLELCPVLPMVMRGVPATREKGIYIFSDAAREARVSGVNYGNFYDPIGAPVRQAYSLYPWAKEQGKDIELTSAFLRCAFSLGVNLNRKRGFQKMVEMAGLDWGEARQILGSPGWEVLLEDNRQVMYQSGLWGVPSFRLLDPAGNELVALWGQDRLWLLARKIQQQLAAREQSPES